jgi:uncharacterized protein YbjT (DUF2867 family)
MKTALLAGTTGLIGSQLLDKLLSSDYYDKVIALTRRVLVRSHPKLVNVVTDFRHLDQVLKDLEPDDVFCCLGTTMAKAGSKERFYEVDFYYPLKVATITEGLGAQQFLLVSALGANKNSSVYYNRVKGEVEEAISAVGFGTVHIFRPSLLLGPRQEKRPGEDAAKWLYKVFGFAIPARYKAISSERVALAMLARAREDVKGTFVHESLEIAKE